MTSSAALPDDVRADLQGLISSGYGHLPHAAYLFFGVHDAAGARAWLGRLAPAITTARAWPVSGGRTIKPSMALNVAFSADGLAALGLQQEVLCTFPAEFVEGITHPDRSRVLGDTEESAPALWNLGGPG